MTQENKSQKKVDYKILSNVRCSVCGRPLKQNTADKGHSKCYVCFKLSQGKRFYYAKNGNLIDRLAIQKANILEYKGVLA